MTTEKINGLMKDLADMVEMKKAAEAQIEMIQDGLKEYMKAAGIDEILSDNGHKVTWRETISRRFDSTAFKKDFADIYEEYRKETAYKRFTFV